MALFLKRRGVERIRPLAGGLVGWSEQGYPLEPMSPASVGSEGETQAEESA
jgi:3-mercaptopyruvate sulfurtransferase SseA